MEGCCCGGLFGSVTFGSLLPRYQTDVYIYMYIYTYPPTYCIAAFSFFFLYVGTYIGYNTIQVYK